MRRELGFVAETCISTATRFLSAPRPVFLSSRVSVMLTGAFFGARISLNSKIHNAQPPAAMIAAVWTHVLRVSPRVRGRASHMVNSSGLWGPFGKRYAVTLPLDRRCGQAAHQPALRRRSAFSTSVGRNHGLGYFP